MGMKRLVYYCIGATCRASMDCQIEHWEWMASLFFFFSPSVVRFLGGSRPGSEVLRIGDMSRSAVPGHALFWGEGVCLGRRSETVSTALASAYAYWGGRSYRLRHGLGRSLYRASGPQGFAGRTGPRSVSERSYFLIRRPRADDGLDPLWDLGTCYPTYCR